MWDVFFFKSVKHWLSQGFNTLSTIRAAPRAEFYNVLDFPELFLLLLLMLLLLLLFLILSVELVGFLVL